MVVASEVKGTGAEVITGLPLSWYFLIRIKLS